MYEVRRANAGDIPAMLGVYRPYAEETTISFEYGAPTLACFTQRILSLLENYPVYVCELQGRVCAFAYAAPAFERRAYAWCLDLSVYVQQGLHGQGMGRALENAVARDCTRLGYRKLYALITEENGASIAFHEAAGYTKVAFFPEQGYKLGRWLGVYWLEKQLNDGTCAARFPRLLHEEGI